MRGYFNIRMTDNQSIIIVHYAYIGKGQGEWAFESVDDALSFLRGHLVQMEATETESDDKR